jgi:hypothetical protein
MSRLDSFIRRLKAQRACLNAAATLIADHPGGVLELGLGNGRTYDHLREILPGRMITVFDRQVAAHPDCIPPKEQMFLGELADTMPVAAQRLGPSAALAHIDIGSGDAEANRAVAALVTRLLPPLLQPGAIIVADQELSLPGQTLPLPDGVKPGRYQMLRWGVG